MKIILISASLLFDLCKQTATIASSQCESDKVPAKCNCSAQKQLLACYSECAGDPAVLGVQQEQRQNMMAVCAQPGAEAETKMRQKNNAKNTMGVPVHVNEPFTVKPKLQSVPMGDDGGDGAVVAQVDISATQEYQAQSTDEEDQSTNSNNENTESTDSNNNDRSDTVSDPSHVSSSSGVSHMVAQTPLFAILCTGVYLLS
ncbi:unnamed protein product [Absidia cylindrospora]